MLGTQTRGALCPCVLNGDSDRFERLGWKHGTKRSGSLTQCS